ncbi:hypothetical protein SNEBB_004391 [Seison nebaliae]|nr:hypothetical protein SNEBB_004391 [Seison nebaliae]
MTNGATYDGASAYYDETIFNLTEEKIVPTIDIRRTQLPISKGNNLQTSLIPFSTPNGKDEPTTYYPTTLHRPTNMDVTNTNTYYTYNTDEVKTLLQQPTTDPLEILPANDSQNLSQDPEILYGKELSNNSKPSNDNCTNTNQSSKPHNTLVLSTDDIFKEHITKRNFMKLSPESDKGENEKLFHYQPNQTYSDTASPQTSDQEKKDVSFYNRLLGNPTNCFVNLSLRQMEKKINDTNAELEIDTGLRRTSNPEKEKPLLIIDADNLSDPVLESYNSLAVYTKPIKCEKNNKSENKKFQDSATSTPCLADISEETYRMSSFSKYGVELSPFSDEVNVNKAISIQNPGTKFKYNPEKHIVIILDKSKLVQKKGKQVVGEETFVDPFVNKKSLRMNDKPQIRSKSEKESQRKKPMGESSSVSRVNHQKHKKMSLSPAKMGERKNKIRTTLSTKMEKKEPFKHSQTNFEKHMYATSCTDLTSVANCNLPNTSSKHRKGLDFDNPFTTDIGHRQLFPRKMIGVLGNTPKKVINKNFPNPSKTIELSNNRYRNTFKDDYGHSTIPFTKDSSINSLLFPDESRIKLTPVTPNRVVPTTEVVENNCEIFLKKNGEILNCTQKPFEMFVATLESKSEEENEEEFKVESEKSNSEFDELPNTTVRSMKSTQTQIDLSFPITYFPTISKENESIDNNSFGEGSDIFDSKLIELKHKNEETELMKTEETKGQTFVELSSERETPKFKNEKKIKNKAACQIQ